MTTPDLLPAANRIEELWSDYKTLIEYLQSENQARLQTRVDAIFPKTLLIAIASYCEVEMTATILQIYSENTQRAEPLIQFVGQQAIGRRFAQLFQWDDRGNPSRNANSFYNLFGPTFSSYMRNRVRGDRGLDEAVRAFLEIGSLRNQLVHENYADFTLSKTANEVYDLYHKAIRFLQEFPIAMRECIGDGTSGNSP